MKWRLTIFLKTYFWIHAIYVGWCLMFRKSTRQILPQIGLSEECRRHCSETCFLVLETAPNRYQLLLKKLLISTGKILVWINRWNTLNWNQECFVYFIREESRKPSWAPREEIGRPLRRVICFATEATVCEISLVFAKIPVHGGFDFVMKQSLRKGHQSKSCYNKTPCTQCNGRHATVMHFDSSEDKCE